MPQTDISSGANQGVGFETAKNLLLSSANYHVLIGSRDPTKGLAAVTTLKESPIKGTVSFIQIDVTNTASVDAAVKQVSDTYGRLDILVNNAGIISTNPVLAEALRETLEVNCVGVVIVTEAFIPLLRKSSTKRLVFISSGVSSISHAANPESRYYRPYVSQYRVTKAGLNMLLVQYWAKLKEEGFKVFGADPGLVATNLHERSRTAAMMGADVGGGRVAVVVKGERDEFEGKVCGAYGVLEW